MYKDKMKTSFLIKQTYFIKGIGTVLSGTIQKGILKKGMTIHLEGTIFEIEKLEKKNQIVGEVKGSELIGVSIKKSQEKDFFKKYTDQIILFEEKSNTKKNIFSHFINWFKNNRNC